MGAVMVDVLEADCPVWPDGTTDRRPSVVHLPGWLGGDAPDWLD